MKTTLYDQQRDLPISAPSVERVVSFLSDALRIRSDEVIVHFATKKKIGQVHKDFFNDPSPTDCITFPLDPSGTKGVVHAILGEILICPKIAIEYGQEHGIDPYEETTRYLVHGMLHLIGYDDMTKEERLKMRAKENRCMKLLLDQGLQIFGGG